MNQPPDALAVLEIEQSLRRAVPEAVFASPRVVRRIIRADLDLPLLMARVPHRESISLSPARLLELADDVWTLPAELPAEVLLVARPEAAVLAASGPTALVREYWRRLYHGCLDVAARRAIAPGGVGDRARADLLAEIGDTALDEARTVLAQEGLLRDPADGGELLCEFMATYLELEAFAPRLLGIWFPAVEDAPRLAEVFAAVTGAGALLERTRPAGLPGGGRVPPVAPAIHAAVVSGSCGAGAAAAVSGHATVRRRAGVAARRGNDVRAALSLWRLRHDPADDGRAKRQLAARVRRLVGRLDRAVGLGETTEPEAEAVVAGLLDRAGGSAWSPPARFLYDLQKICVDCERESYRTQLVSWAVSLGRVPLIRPLPAQRVALVHRHMAAAARRLPSLALPEPLARQASALVGPGLDATETTVRERLGPPIRRALVEAGLAPGSVVEAVAFDKLVDEILDGIAERGFASFGDVRDAVSRSQVKLPDLASAGELVGGDPLLRADRNLGTSLDGAYRRAPSYLLAMQRLSAVAFGVPLGRAITLHLLLPFGGAWILWRGLEHVLEPLTTYSFGHAWHVYSRSAVVVTGFGIWGLMHVPPLRRAAAGFLRAIGAGLHLLCIDLPRRLLRLPLVERALRSRPVRLFRRYAWSPLVAATGIWLVLPHDGGWFARTNPWMPAILFGAAATVLNSPVGREVQERLLEGLGRALHQLHATLIVAVVAWIIDTFRRAVDLLEGTLYAVDEQLRFRAGESRLALAVKAALTTAWAAVDWVVRFAVTLLIEPQLNPIKHFPVVTVSHKLLVPMIPVVATNLAAATGMEKGLAFTTVTAVSTATPGVFGFLAWELKENWRLYAANRPRLLRPVRVGRHGETMRRLLLPGFHSGTIPKLFAKLRRQAGGREVGTAAAGPWRAEERLVELAHDVAGFVEDECLGLLRRTGPFADLGLRVSGVRLATNMVSIDVAADGIAAPPLGLTLVQERGVITSRVVEPGWLASLDDDRRRLVDRAFAGFQAICGVDFAAVAFGRTAATRPAEDVEWAGWRATWERERAGDAPAAGPPAAGSAEQ